MIEHNRIEMHLNQSIVDGDETLWDISQLIGKITWSGNKNTAPRTLEFEVLRSKYGHNNPIIIREGNTVNFSYNGEHIFTGWIFNIRHNNNGMKVTAYDPLFFLVKDKASLLFKNFTASWLLDKMVYDYGLLKGEIDSTQYKIPYRFFDGDSVISMIQTSLYLTYKQTGKMFYMFVKDGLVHLKLRGNIFNALTIDDTKNLPEEWEYEISAEDTYSVVDVRAGDEKNPITSRDWNDHLVKKIGYSVWYEKVTDKLSKADLDKRAKNIAKEKNRIEQTLRLPKMRGRTTATSNTGMIINIPRVQLKGYYYIVEDTHYFTNESHTMDLRLSAYNDYEKVEAGREEEEKPNA